MFRRIWDRRPQPAMVVAVAALVVALGGVAGAQAGLIGSNGIANNAIKSRHVAPNAVQTTDIAPNAVTQADIKNGTITSADIGPAAVTPADLAGGPSVSVTRTGNANLGGNPATTPCAVFGLPTWSTTDGYDSGSFLHTSGTYLVVPTAGVYDVELTVPWDDTAGGWREIAVAIDPTVGPNSGVAQVRGNQVSGTSDGEGIVLTGSGVVEAAAGDVLAVVLTSCGHASSVGLSTDVPARLSATWVRPLVN